MSKHTIDKAAGITVADVLALQAENADLKAALAVYAPPAPDPVPYPAWRYQRDAQGQITAQVIVVDATDDAKLGKGWA